LTNSGDPILDARVRDIGGTVEHQLALDDQTFAGWIGNGIPMTWAPNGIAFLTGAAHFGTATALTIGRGAPPSASPTGTASAAP
jgi:hypothetical protein